MFFRDWRIKFYYIIWLDCEPYGKNQCKKKEYTQHSSVFKQLKKLSLANLLKITFILFECQRFVDKSINLSLFLLS